MLNELDDQNRAAASCSPSSRVTRAVWGIVEVKNSWFHNRFSKELRCMLRWLSVGFFCEWKRRKSSCDNYPQTCFMSDFITQTHFFTSFKPPSSCQFSTCGVFSKELLLFMLWHNIPRGAEQFTPDMTELPRTVFSCHFVLSCLNFRAWNKYASLPTCICYSTFW